MSTRNVALVVVFVLLQAVFIKDAHGQAETCRILDLAFVIDASGSICDGDPGFDYNRDNTCNNWNFMRDFVYRIVDSLGMISPDTTRVAVITFETNAMLRWNLTAYPDKASLLDAIKNRLPYSKGGRTDTAGALNMLVSQVFGTSGDRQNVNNTAIIITDGHEMNNATVPAAIQAVHNAGIRTLVVGVTPQVDNATLKLLSSPPQQENVTYFWAKDFQTIDHVRAQLTAQACQIKIPTVRPSPPVTLAQIACDQIDLCLIVDRSGSICDSDKNFVYTRDETCNNWASIVTFMQNILNNLNIGPSNVRVAMVIVSSSAEVAWGLATYTSKTRLMTAISDLQYIKGGTTDTTGGLDVARTRVFNTADDRPNVANVAIIITDGNPTVPATVPGAVKALQDGGCRTLVVGVTDSFNMNTLKLLSSPPQQAGITFFVGTDYSTVNALRISLQALICPQPTRADQIQYPCRDVHDLVIVLDGSGSICDSDPRFNFQTDLTCDNWAFIVQFLHNLINDYFVISPAATRVALILFSNDARLVWGLDAYTDKATLLYAIDNLQYIKGGTTDTTGALNVLNAQVFTPQLTRPNAAKTAIIVTDGKPTVPSTVEAAVRAVENSGIRRLVVGVTNQIDNRTLKQISSPPKTFGETYFVATDYRTLSAQVSAQLIAKACPGTSTTTTGTTTVTTPSSTPYYCRGILDLAFVVDGSGSICNDLDVKTCDNWKAIIDFLRSIVAAMSVSPNEIRVGMIVFASEQSTRVLWNLTTYMDKVSLMQAIDNMQYVAGGTTFLTDGLYLLRTVVFGGSADRSNVANAAIIITDGKPTNYSTVPAAIDAVHKAGIYTLVVGITNMIDEDELRLISSPPKKVNVNYFMTPDYNLFANVGKALLESTCNRPTAA